MRIIIDTSIVVARIDERDSQRAVALALWKSLEQVEASLLFLDCVANETISVLARRCEERRKQDEWTLLFSRYRAFVERHPPVWVSREIERLFSAVLDLVSVSGGKLNFHDALIALLAREHGIRDIASLDPDFDRVPWLRRISSPVDLGVGPEVSEDR